MNPSLNQIIRFFSSQLTFAVNTLGGELTSIKNRQDDWEFLWDAKPAIWNRHAPVLFPIVGKLNGNTLKIEGQNYPMGQHGFARDQEFEVVEMYTDLVRLMLQSSRVSLGVYPYEYRLFITYQAIGNRLDTTYEIQNTGKQEMYFSIGAHPGFRLPDNSLDQLVIHFEKPEFLKRCLLQDGLFTGETEPMGEEVQELKLNSQLFERDALVWKGLNSNWLELRKLKDSFCIRMEFADFPFFGMWKKPESNGFLCLEPWSGLADSIDFEGDISEKEGIIRLEPGSTKMMGFITTFYAPGSAEQRSA